MQRKPSFEEYREVGDCFKIVCRKTTHLYVRLANIFGVEALEPLYKADRKINKVRSKLEDCMCGEYPGKSSQEILSVFYGGEKTEIKQLEDIPESIQHNELTFEQYKEIGNELKMLEKSIQRLATKAYKLHGKTIIRGLLDLCAGSQLIELSGNLQIIEFNDLRNKGYSMNELDNVFWGSLTESVF